MEVKTKKININPKVVSGGFVVGMGIFLLMLLIQQFVFDIKELLKASWWITQIEKSICLGIMYNGIVQIFYESRNKNDGYKLVRDNYSHRLTIVDRLAYLRTKDAIKNQIGIINEKAIFETKFGILSKAVEDMFCDELKGLSESFDDFNKKYNSTFWKLYFKTYEVTRRRQKQIKKAVKRINKGDFKIEKLTTNDILIDNEFGNKNTNKVTAAKFSFNKILYRSTFFKIFIGLAIAMLFGSIFIGDSVVSAKQVLFTIIAHLFVAIWTLATGIHKSFQIIAIRKVALKNRISIIDDAMVNSKLFETYQQNLDKILPPDKRLISDE